MDPQAVASAEPRLTPARIRWALLDGMRCGIRGALLDGMRWASDGMRPPEFSTTKAASFRQPIPIRRPLFCTAVSPPRGGRARGPLRPLAVLDDLAHDPLVRGGATLPELRVEQPKLGHQTANF